MTTPPPKRRRRTALKQVVARAPAADGPVVVEVPIGCAENDKLGMDLWQLAPEVERWRG